MSLPDNYKPRKGDELRYWNSEYGADVAHWETAHITYAEHKRVDIDGETSSLAHFLTQYTDWTLHVRGALTLEEREALPAPTEWSKPTPENVQQLLRATWAELVKMTKRVREPVRLPSDCEGPEDMGRRIRHLREASGKSLTQFADQCSISKGYLSSIESGAKSNPTLDVVRRIASELGVTLGDIIIGTEPTNASSKPTYDELEARVRELEAHTVRLESQNEALQEELSSELMEHVRFRARGRWNDVAKAYEADPSFWSFRKFQRLVDLGDAEWVGELTSTATRHVRWVDTDDTEPTNA